MAAVQVISDIALIGRAVRSTNSISNPFINYVDAPRQRHITNTRKKTVYTVSRPESWTSYLLKLHIRHQGRVRVRYKIRVRVSVKVSVCVKVRMDICILHIRDPHPHIRIIPKTTPKVYQTYLTHTRRIRFRRIYKCKRSEQYCSE